MTLNSDLLTSKRAADYMRRSKHWSDSASRQYWLTRNEKVLEIRYR